MKDLQNLDLHPEKLEGENKKEKFTYKKYRQFCNDGF